MECGEEKTWAVEVPVLGILSQGETREGSLAMIKGAVELASEVAVEVEAEKDSLFFTVKATNDYGSIELYKFMFRQMRGAENLSLREAGEKLGSTSPNAYGRYEQGTLPRLETLEELFAIGGGEPVLGFIPKRRA